jgi:uncharacterized membrane protein YgcG
VYTYYNTIQMINTLVNPSNPYSEISSLLWRNVGGSTTTAIVHVSTTNTIDTNKLVAGQAFGTQPGNTYYNPNAITVSGGSGSSNSGSSGGSSSSSSSGSSGGSMRCPPC